MPGLDALRGVAILSVLLYHGLSWDIPQAAPHGSWAWAVTQAMTCGWLGVFLFFVLSGFLITGILSDSRERPHYWRNFYVRRVLRILPIFVLVLAIIKVFFHGTWSYVTLCLFYGANLAPMLGIGGFTYGLLWSLAVEEQFYLGWPVLARYLTPRRLAMVAIGSILLSPALRALSASGMVPLGNPHFMTWLISDNLSMGALLALVLRSRWGTEERVRQIAWGLLAGGAGMLLVGLPFGILSRNNLIGAALQTVPFELMFGGALLFALKYGGSPAVLAWTRPLRFLGLISYGLYLYHWFTFLIFDAATKNSGYYDSWSTGAWLMRFGVCLAVSIGLAWLSRATVEEFFLGLKGKLTPP